MEKQGRVIGIFVLVILQVFFLSCFSWGGGSSSANYTLPTSVFSGGGAPMHSSNFGTIGTIGQPSPLMDPADPPYSDSYDLYPGFWYTFGAVVECGDLASFAATFGLTASEEGYNPGCDSERDGDVDGVDLAEYADTF